MKTEHANCGYADVGMPMDTAGNTYVWHCECATTACQNTQCEAPRNYFEELYANKLSSEEEERFYKKVFKTMLR